MTGTRSDTSVEVRVVGGDQWERWRDIRLRALQDAPSAFGSTYAREQAFTEADWRARIGHPGEVMVLGTAAAEVVAMGGGYQDLPGWLHVVAMWVDPDWRGLRVGHRVLDMIKAWADQHGLRLHLDVAQGNPAARTSYQRYGFAPTGETRPIRDGATELVERMVLPTAGGVGRS